ncbi:nuclear transport factor 2 family protein [Nocardia terpenica]|uniref:Nuclear transport factor 2 family protein n=1 Tax=Nocardia terpenica TaxID=455432 RepID=A0A6G9Z6V1_9NOCA|nr:nuclear transport factor 2 family protein [Nocardia terpenica]QIS21222.1 nuclear transport factor 2 family protein [Nocardia terpenica]
MKNVDRVQRYYDLVDAGEVDELVNLFAEEAVYHRPGYPPMVGRAALSEFYRTQRVIKFGAHTLSQVTAAESDVAVHGEFAGVLKDDSEVTVRFADFFALDADGFFTRRVTFFFAPSV